MATLNISDLSVGDWVQDNYGNYVKVMGIWQGCNFNYQVDILRDGRTGTIVPCNLHPIPITVEILEKNEFTRRSSEFPIYEYTTLLGKMLRTTVVSLNYPYSYIVCKIEDTSKELHEFGRITVGTSIDRNPIHIHDLQHAMRLAGAAKEFVIPNK